MDKTTMPQILHPLMHGYSLKMQHCAICGRPHPLEQHHVVFRSSGELYLDGIRKQKPTITLCGFGNNLKDADGRYLCHGLAHHRMLHFRWIAHQYLAGAGHWEYLKTHKPVEYAVALEMDGWKRVK